MRPTHVMLLTHFTGECTEAACNAPCHEDTYTGRSDASITTLPHAAMPRPLAAKEPMTLAARSLD